MMMIFIVRRSIFFFSFQSVYADFDRIEKTRGKRNRRREKKTTCRPWCGFSLSFSASHNLTCEHRHPPVNFLHSQTRCRKHSKTLPQWAVINSNARVVVFFCPSVRRWTESRSHLLRLLLLGIESCMSIRLRAVLYFIFLLYLFLGIAIIADIFMSSIETITSRRRKIRYPDPDAKDKYLTVEVRLWNDTVANLTLMALGSSSPEILLSIIEIVGNRFEAGELGPGTSKTPILRDFPDESEDWAVPKNNEFRVGFPWEYHFKWVFSLSREFFSFLSSRRFGGLQSINDLCAVYICNQCDWNEKNQIVQCVYGNSSALVASNYPWCFSSNRSHHSLAFSLTYGCFLSYRSYRRMWWSSGKLSLHFLCFPWLSSLLFWWARSSLGWTHLRSRSFLFRPRRISSPRIRLTWKKRNKHL